MEQTKAPVVIVTLDELMDLLIRNDYQDYRNFTLHNPSIPVKTRVAEQQVKRINYHCTDANGWSPARLSDFMVNERNFSICSYHYYVSDKIYHMVGENIITPNAAPFNKDSVAFAIDYSPTIFNNIGVLLHPEIEARAKQLAAFLCIKWKVPPTDKYLKGHRELPFTGFFVDQAGHRHLRKECPGMAINLQAFRYDVCKIVQTILNKLRGSSLAIDGIYGPKTADALVTTLIHD